MQKNNVKIGEIRLEDSFDEAKIFEPIPLRSFGDKCHASMENNDDIPEGQNGCFVPRTGTVYRED